MGGRVLISVGGRGRVLISVGEGEGFSFQWGEGEGFSFQWGGRVLISVGGRVLISMKLMKMLWLMSHECHDNIQEGGVGGGDKRP